MDTPLKNKVALVTGASSGIGAATTRSLAENGAKVIITARRTERLRQLQDEFGDLIHVIAADITSEPAVESLIRDALAWSGGQLDILVNNAGLSRGGILDQSDPADLRVTIGTNFSALVDITRLALPALKAAKGTIINISSGAAKSAPAGNSVYAAAKAAVATFSESLRKEVGGLGVRVTSILPGFIETEFFDAITPEKKEGLLQAMAQMEPLKATDLADLILFILTRPAYVSLNEVVIRPTKQP